MPLAISATDIAVDQELEHVQMIFAAMEVPKMTNKLVIKEKRPVKRFGGRKEREKQFSRGNGRKRKKGRTTAAK